MIDGSLLDRAWTVLDYRNTVKRKEKKDDEFGDEFVKEMEEG